MYGSWGALSSSYDYGTSITVPRSSQQQASDAPLHREIRKELVEKNQTQHIIIETTSNQFVIIKNNNSFTIFITKHFIYIFNKIIMIPFIYY